MTGPAIKPVHGQPHSLTQTRTILTSNQKKRKQHPRYLQLAAPAHPAQAEADLQHTGLRSPDYQSPAPAMTVEPIFRRQTQKLIDTQTVVKVNDLLKSSQVENQQNQQRALADHIYSAVESFEASEGRLEQTLLQ